MAKVLFEAAMQQRNKAKPRPNLCKGRVACKDRCDLRTETVGTLSHNRGVRGELAAREGRTERYIARVIPLISLSPKIQSALLEGSQPVDLSGFNF